MGINISWNAITEEFHIKSLLKAELIIDGVVIKGVYPHLDAASPKHPSYEGLQNGILESLRGIRVYFLIKSINMASLEFKTDSAAGHRIIDTLATMQSYK